MSFPKYVTKMFTDPMLSLRRTDPKDVLLPHAGRLVVRSGYPRSGCSTMLVSSQASYFLSTAVCVEPHPADASKAPQHGK